MIDLRAWIMLLLCLPGWLERVLKRIDVRAEAYARSLISTKAQAAVILGLFDVKRRLLNLWVARRGIVWAMKGAAVDTVRFAAGCSIAALADNSGRSYRAAGASVERGFAAAEEYLKASGMNETALKDDYSDVPIIRELIDAYNKRLGCPESKK